jgi:hypothetical protein
MHRYYIQIFEHCIQRADNLLHLNHFISSTLPHSAHHGDMLRAAIILSTAGLDNLLVNLCCHRMGAAFRGVVPQPQKLEKVGIPADVILNHGKNADEIELAYREIIKFRSDQNPDKIRDYVREVYHEDIWTSLSAEINMPSATIKSSLSAICRRRNIIAHEGDTSTALPVGELINISQEDTSYTVRFIEQFGRGCYAVLMREMIALTPPAPS